RDPRRNDTRQAAREAECGVPLGGAEGRRHHDGRYRRGRRHRHHRHLPSELDRAAAPLRVRCLDHRQLLLAASSGSARPPAGAESAADAHPAAHAHAHAAHGARADRPDAVTVADGPAVARTSDGAGHALIPAGVPARVRQDGTVSDDAMAPASFLIDAGGDAGTDPRAFATGVAELEAAGYDGIFAAETKHDPFISLTAAAMRTERVDLMTGIAVAFARNPMTVAETANDLQLVSGGRFILGLGSQIKPHIEHRFSMPWSAP